MSEPGQPQDGAVPPEPAAPMSATQQEAIAAAAAVAAVAKAVEPERASFVRLFSLSERIGRLRFLVYAMVAGISCSVLLFAIFQAAGYLPYSVAMLLYRILYICTTSVVLPVILFVLSIRRLHDMDKPGWWVVLGAAVFFLAKWIPIASLAMPVMFLFLLAYPGSKGANRFGPLPPRNGQALITTSLVLPVALFLLFAGSEQRRREAAASNAQRSAPGMDGLRQYSPVPLPGAPAKPPPPPLKRYDQPR